MDTGCDPRFSILDPRSLWFRWRMKIEDRELKIEDRWTRAAILDFLSSTLDPFGFVGVLSSNRDRHLSRFAAVRVLHEHRMCRWRNEDIPHLLVARRAICIFTHNPEVAVELQRKCLAAIDDQHGSRDDI